MKKILLITVFPILIYACGCTDAGSANSYAEKAKSVYDSKDSELAKNIDSFNEIYKEVKGLVNTKDYNLTTNAKYMQIYQQRTILNQEKRQQINAIIQKLKDQS